MGGSKICAAREEDHAVIICPDLYNKEVYLDVAEIVNPVSSQDSSKRLDVAVTATSMYYLDSDCVSHGDQYAAEQHPASTSQDIQPNHLKLFSPFHMLIVERQFFPQCSHWLIHSKFGGSILIENL